MKKALSVFTSLCLILMLLPSAVMAGEADRYSDVSADAWYCEAVDFVSEQGLMNGESDHRFNPDGTATRGTIVTVLARYDGVDTSGSDPWYQAGVDWAKEQGVSDGSNPQKNVTRQEFATMLWRFAGSSDGPEDVLADFSDADDVSDYAVRAMAWAVKQGVLRGDEKARLNPAGTATRAELAAMIFRFAGLTEEDPTYTIDNIRNYVVGVDEPMTFPDGTTRPLINFDNAATTPALQPVMDEVNDKLVMYGSIGRGFSQKSNYSTEIYNQTREKVLEFVNADPETYTCFYVNNTTDGLNKLASALIESEDDLVLATRIEHHANDLSWRERCKVIYAEVDDLGRVRYDELERLLRENQVQYVTVTAASNVTGYVTDVHRVAKLAHQYGAQIIVDGAQIVAHRAFSMLGDTPEENIDFLVFSAHKMYSPYGGGAVVGLTETLNQHMPEFYGGGTIRIVSDDWVTYKDAPAAYEAGSPNYPGVVGMGKAIDVLQEVGFDKIEAHEKELNQRLIDGLKKLDNVIIYGDTEDISDRVGVVTFNFSDVNSYLLATMLADSAVATRRGAFCAHPYVWRLMNISEEQQKGFLTCTDGNTAGMIRVSFGIYNTPEEVDDFLEILGKTVVEARDRMERTNFIPEY